MKVVKWVSLIVALFFSIGAIAQDISSTLSLGQRQSPNMSIWEAAKGDEAQPGQLTQLQCKNGGTWCAGSCCTSDQKCCPSNVTSYCTSKRDKCI